MTADPCNGNVKGGDGCKCPPPFGSDRPKRIQLRRTKGWRKPEGAVVVSRPSKWGNPWRVDRDMEIYWSVRDHALAVTLFEDMLSGHRGDRYGYPSDSEIRFELRGKDLACWCPLDQPCHADVLIEIANGADR